MRTAGRVLLGRACAQRTQRAIAKETAISPTTINDHVAGRSEPSLRHAIAYRDKLAIAVDAWIEEWADEQESEIEKFGKPNARTVKLSA